MGDALDLIEAHRRGDALTVPDDFLAAAANTLAQPDADPAFQAEALIRFDPILPPNPFAPSRHNSSSTDRKEARRQNSPEGCAEVGSPCALNIR